MAVCFLASFIQSFDLYHGFGSGQIFKLTTLKRAYQSHIDLNNPMATLVFYMTFIASTIAFEIMTINWVNDESKFIRLSNYYHMLSYIIRLKFGMLCDNWYVTYLRLGIYCFHYFYLIFFRIFFFIYSAQWTALQKQLLVLYNSLLDMFSAMNLHFSIKAPRTELISFDT